MAIVVTWRSTRPTRVHALLCHESSHMHSTGRSHTWVWHAEGHVGEVEATRCASRGVVVEREMSITVCVASRGSDMSWVEHVAVDESHLLID